ncbi:MAG: hypothetical protein ACRCR1_14290 [Aeromonas sp.]
MLAIEHNGLNKQQASDLAEDTGRLAAKVFIMQTMGHYNKFNFINNLCGSPQRNDIFLSKKLLNLN